MTFHSTENSTCNLTFVDDDSTSSRQDSGVNGDAAGRSENSDTWWTLPLTISNDSTHLLLSAVSILRNHPVSPQPEVTCPFPCQSMYVGRQGECGSERRLNSTVAVIDAALGIILEDEDDEIFGSKQHSHHEGHSMSDGSFQRQ